MEGGKGGLGVLETPTGKMVHHFSYANLLFIFFNKAAQRFSCACLNGVKVCYTEAVFLAVCPAARLVLPDPVTVGQVSR